MVITESGLTIVGRLCSCIVIASLTGMLCHYFIGEKDIEAILEALLTYSVGDSCMMVFPLFFFFYNSNFYDGFPLLFLSFFYHLNYSVVDDVPYQVLVLFRFSRIHSPIVDDFQIMYKLQTIIFWSTIFGYSLCLHLSGSCRPLNFEKW